MSTGPSAVTSEDAREIFDLVQFQSGSREPRAQTVAISIMACPVLARGGSRSGALSSIEPICGDLAFRGHRSTRRLAHRRSRQEWNFVGLCFDQPIRTLPQILGQTRPEGRNGKERLVTAEFVGHEQFVDALKII